MKGALHCRKILIGPVNWALGTRSGLFALMDLAGNDLGLKIMKTLHEAYGERFRPRPSLVNKVDAGHFGRKAGKGWLT